MSIPVSGRRNVAPVLREVGYRLAHAGATVTVRVTRAAGDAERIAGDAPADTRAILAVGGDGTVREVVDGQLSAGRTIPITILRTGTENIVARNLGMAADAAGITRTLLDGQTTPCDVGVANGRHFLIVTGAGFDAEVVERLVADRDGHITHWDYFWPVWRTFLGHRFPRLIVTADGTEVFDGCGMAFVGVIPRYSVGLRILSKSVQDDGMLDLCIYPCASRVRLVRHALDTFCRRHDVRGRIIYHKCRQIRIESPQRVPVEMDGDAGGQLPAECGVLPSAAIFLTPAKPAGHRVDR